jgi:hypothetical protein
MSHPGNNNKPGFFADIGSITSGTATAEFMMYIPKPEGYRNTTDSSFLTLAFKGPDGAVGPYVKDANWGDQQCIVEYVGATASYEYTDVRLDEGVWNHVTVTATHNGTEFIQTMSCSTTGTSDTLTNYHPLTEIGGFGVVNWAHRPIPTFFDAVPEPSTGVLMATLAVLGGVAMTLRRRRT